MIKIITVGKNNELWAEVWIADYQRRLDKVYKLDWKLVPNAGVQGVSGQAWEAKWIMKYIDSTDYLLVLDERGQMVTSPDFANLISNTMSTGQKLVILIGGAYGVHETILKRADAMISLGAMTFPHQMVRVMLTEQIYRAQQINRGHPYHHG